METLLGSLETVSTSVKTLQGVVISLSERFDAFPATVASMIDDAKEELLSEIRPIARAVDKDAVTLVDHEKRITRIEHKIILK